MSNEGFETWFREHMPTGDISVYRAAELAFNAVASAQPQKPTSQFLQFILDGAENVDLNHRDFRIQVAQMAQIEMDKIAAISRPVRPQSEPDTSQDRGTQ